jgi:hypothetical protein
MQKILTLSLFEGRKMGNLNKTLSQLKQFDDRVEVIYHPFGVKPDKELYPAFFGLEIDNFGKFANISLSLAKGKYFMCTDAEFLIDEQNFDKFLTALQKSNAAAITFEKQKLCRMFALKTVEAKKNTQTLGSYDFLINLCSATMFATRSAERLNISPFKITRSNDLNFCVNNFNEYKNSADKFCKMFGDDRAKLGSSAYKVIFDALVEIVVERYICSLYLIFKGKLKSEELVKFDENLKDKTPFIYFGAEKQFTAGNLKKLRETEFSKIPFFTKLKINNLIKNN